MAIKHSSDSGPETGLQKYQAYATIIGLPIGIIGLVIGIIGLVIGYLQLSGSSSPLSIPHEQPAASDNKSNRRIQRTVASIGTGSKGTAERSRPVAGDGGSWIAINVQDPLLEIQPGARKSVTLNVTRHGYDGPINISIEN